MKPEAISKNWTFAFMAFGAAAGLVTLITYIEMRNHRKVTEHIALLDREIKMLELEKRKKEASAG